MTDPQTKTIRIQRKRTLGWKMPENTVYVGRPSIYGNPFVIGQPSGYLFQDDGDPTPMIVRLTREQCVKFYKDISWGLLSPEMHPHGHEHLKRFRERFKKMTIGDAAKAYLCGKNLACWCKIGEPCHADILLELANK